MNISKPLKILIGLATFWYAAYPFLLVVLIVVGRWSPPLLVGDERVSDLFVEPIFPIRFCTVLVGLSLIAFYLVHIIKHPNIGLTGRAVYGIGILFFPFLVMPIYYYMYVWLENPPAFALRYFPFGTLDDLITRHKRSKQS